MSRIRVYQLAKKIGISNKELIKKLNELSIGVSSHMSTLESENANVVIELLAEEANETNMLTDGKDKELNGRKNQTAQKTKTVDGKESLAIDIGNEKDIKIKT